MNKDTRPLFLFDFGMRETDEALRTRLLLEAQLCLEAANRPQRQMLDELRAYIVKNKGSDARIYPILRILHRYLNVTPTDFRDLVNLIGMNRSLEFIDGVRPPIEVWKAINKLNEENASQGYIREFITRVIDGIEAGEQSEFWYKNLAHDYLYTFRDRGNPRLARRP